MRATLVMLPLLLFAVTAWAQPDPNAPPPPDQQMEMSLMILRMADRMPAIQKVTPTGLFLAHNGILAKFDGATHRYNKAIDLFGPAPAWPESKALVGDLGYAAIIERARRMSMPAIETAGNDLLIIIGGTYFRVDSDTLEVKTIAQVLDPDPLLQLTKSLRKPQGLAIDPLSAFSVAQLSVQDGVLRLVTTQSRVIGVEVASGKVLYNESAPDTLTLRLFPPAKDGPFAEQPEPAEPVENAKLAAIGQLEVLKNGSVSTLVLRESRGTRYVLTGQVANHLKAKLPPDGQQIMVLGLYRKDTPALPDQDTATLRGAIEVTAQVLLTIQPTMIALED